MSGLFIFLVVLAVYFLAVFLLFSFKKDAMEERGISLWGPALMIRTRRGRRLLDRLASKRRFWGFYGDFSVALVMVSMALMFFFLLWTASFVYTMPRKEAPPISMYVGIPGVNPVIPLWEGILGLAVAIVVHEFSHGILTRLGRLSVKSMGILFLIVPIGAFVEPDEDELKKAPRRVRMRVYSAGPSANIMWGLVFALIFSWVLMGSVRAASDGDAVLFVIPNSPAEEAGIVNGSFITSFNGTPIHGWDDLHDAINRTHTGDVVNITLFHRDRGAWNTTARMGYAPDAYFKNQPWYRSEKPSLGLEVDDSGDTGGAGDVGGVLVVEVYKNGPGEKAGVAVGDVIVSLNGTPTPDIGSYHSALDGLTPGENTTLTLFRDGEQTVVNVTVGIGKGFLGVISLATHPGRLAGFLVNPYRDADGVKGFFASTILYISLPFNNIGPGLRMAPMVHPFTDFYTVTGPLSVLPEWFFWGLVNAFYFLFWLNIMVGLTNSLPAVPLDGGYIFKDFIAAVYTRFCLWRKKLADAKKVEAFSGKVTMAASVAVLLLIVWQIVGPRL